MKMIRPIKNSLLDPTFELGMAFFPRKYHFFREKYSIIDISKIIDGDVSFTIIIFQTIVHP